MSDPSLILLKAKCVFNSIGMESVYHWRMITRSGLVFWRKVSADTYHALVQLHRRRLGSSLWSSFDTCRYRDQGKPRPVLDGSFELSAHLVGLDYTQTRQCP
jgi:hypothetical protein